MIPLMIPRLFFALFASGIFVGSLCDHSFWQFLNDPTMIPLWFFRPTPLIGTGQKRPQGGRKKKGGRGRKKRPGPKKKGAGAEKKGDPGQKKSEKKIAITTKNAHFGTGEILNHSKSAMIFKLKKSAIATKNCTYCGW